jgi:hypothetical protein
MSELYTFEFGLNNYSDEEVNILDADAELIEKNYHTIVSKRYEEDETYTQLMQIEVPKLENDDELQCICIDKSTAKNKFYVYLPPNGNDYLFSIDSEVTFQNLLDTIYSIAEFREHYPNMQFDFSLNDDFETNPNQYDSESFLELTLDKIPLAQGVLIERT